MEPGSVELRDATFGYGRRAVIRSLTLAVHQGDFLAVVGPNGSGKTTLLRALAGILRPIGGEVRRAQPLAVGYVPQERDFDPVFPLSALDVVLQGRLGRLPFWRTPGPRDREIAARSLDETGTGALAPRPFFELSAGQKQRILIARALAVDPALLVLDEPTAAADLVAARALMDLLRAVRARRGLAVVLSTHDLDLAGNYATRIALTDADRGMVRVGRTADILRDEALTEIYGRPVRVASVGAWRTVVLDAPPC